MLSFVTTSIFRAVICVRAEIVRVSVGMLGLYRTFFICADGKKTAFVGAVRTFVITADRVVGEILKTEIYFTKIGKCAI